MKRKAIIKLIGLLMISFICIPSSVSALSMPDSWYTDIAWTYTYDAPATWSYNCLGYVTGSMTYEWPQTFGSAATSSTVKTYMLSKGYFTLNISSPTSVTRAIAYGTPNKIVHFGKVTKPLIELTAKWGSAERFKHNNLNPYKPAGPYGNAQMYFS